MNSAAAAATEDLHAHTDASDGALGAGALLALAHRAGVGVLAVTDHDTMDAVPEAIRAGRRLGVRVVPGVELSAHGPAGPIHLLGYFDDPVPRPIADRLAGLMEARRERAAAIVARLAELGVAVSLERIAAGARGAIGRPHIAAAIVAAGAAADLREAFERYLGDAAPAYVPAAGLDDEEAVHLVVASGGAAVLAHPGTLRAGPTALAAQVARLAGAGLRGIEVHRPDHGARERTDYAALAARHRLVATGGSDFHGLGEPVLPGDTGYPPLPPGCADRLLGSGRRSGVGRPAIR
jgi:predicted metal-dependent phosphoesterase TrpH